MTTKLQPVRGTHDVLPQESRERRFIAETARGVAGRYGFGTIELPIFEFSDVFHRTLGDTSDVVTKETYTFSDRGGESLTLRPEFTASVVRAFISNGLQEQLPCKFFYHGPAFRYERPQKGRLRQFHQVGAELLGVAEPAADVEMIALGMDCLGALGLKEKVRLEINTLGDKESREAYRRALVEYFLAHATQLSQDSRMRLERNPLRILDSKDEGDRTLIAGAPKLDAHFTPEARAFFASVRAGLDALGIAFHLNERLVRGLDYYNHTVFEIVATEGLGAQGTVLAGGRYDGLVEMMGGNATPGIGWAAGVERLHALVDFKAHACFIPSPRPVVIIGMGDAAEMMAMKLAHDLRKESFVVELTYRGNMAKRMKRADKLHACAAVIIGDDELRAGEVTLKDLDKGEQQRIKPAALPAALRAFQKGVGA
jgi:histidyl-tRNA synthetase